VAINHSTGFEPIFDGKSLTGWDGNPDAWRVENGAIVGESTAEKPLEGQHFHHLAGRSAKGFRTEARVSNQFDQQWGPVPQQRAARSWQVGSEGIARPTSTFRTPTPDRSTRNGAVGSLPSAVR
jgi:hypothetical protein